MTKHRTSALRADQQPAASKDVGSADQRGGIFGPDWHKWRGASLRVELEGEPPFLARLDAVRGPVPTTGSSVGMVADITELDGALRPVGVRTLPWPPPGTVRVLRSP